ncbi:hypothetical protein BDY24DRAFT_436766 [Mrakia frigida]|uniref:O-fucosyltransferase family protein n=1 Tax=Mrakia frigida TaxID=29902 RepID=UPI003FCC1D30
MNDDEDSSSHPLLPTGSSSRPDSPSQYAPYPSTSNSPSARSRLSLLLSKRPPLSCKGWILLLFASLVGFSLSLVFASKSGNGSIQVEGWSWKTRPKASEGLVKEGGRRGRNESYTENLLPNINYITSFHIAGLNNEIITQFNLLHLTYLSRKNAASPVPYTPVLPPFLPHFGHLTGGEGKNSAPLLRFSQVFDIDRLAELLGFGILEWADLKEGFAGAGMGGVIEDEWATEEERQATKAASAGQTLEKIGAGLEKEPMGCWSSSMAVNRGNIIGNGLEDYYNFKPIWTPLPYSLFASTDRGPHHLLLPSLANFITPPDNRLRTEYLKFTNDEAQRMITSWDKNKTKEDVFDKKKGWIEPNVKKGSITCFDLLYYASDKGEEVREVYRCTPPVPRNQGPWWSVGQYAHWNSDLRKIGVDTLRKVIGLPEGKAIPNVFTVHIRRTDFMPSCPDYAKPCLAVSHFSDHLNGMRERYVDNVTRSAKDWPVVVTTDESDPEYLAEITALGWFLVDHHALNTKHVHGIWYPSLIDNVVLSLGRGLVGTKSSTMSILASRRVEDWNGGQTERVGPLESKWPYDPKIDYSLVG